MVKVAINGFGRIGRNKLRAAIREGIYNEIDYVGDRISDAHDLRITDIEYIKNTNSTTINYDDVQGVKYVDIKIGDGKEQSACDWITLTIGIGNLSATDKRYICNPSDPNYIFTYNN